MILGVCSLSATLFAERTTHGEGMTTGVSVLAVHVPVGPRHMLMVRAVRVGD